MPISHIEMRMSLYEGMVMHTHTICIAISMRDPNAFIANLLYAAPMKWINCIFMLWKINIFVSGLPLFKLNHCEVERSLNESVSKIDFVKTLIFCVDMWDRRLWKSIHVPVVTRVRSSSDRTVKRQPKFNYLIPFNYTVSIVVDYGRFKIQLEHDFILHQCRDFPDYWFLEQIFIATNKNHANTRTISTFFFAFRLNTWEQ